MAQMIFISVDSFKLETGATSLDVVHNPSTNKVFMLANNKPYKVQQDINPNLPIRFMYEEGKFDDGCLTNVKPLETRFTL